MSLDAALNAFSKVQARYSKFGAGDTEPRGVLTDLIEQVHGGNEPTVPTTARGWQIFTGMPGSEAAAAAMGAAGKAVVEAAKTDAIGTARYMRNYY